jgi:hypothetical protein
VAVSKMELLELLRKADGADVDFLREGVRVLAQALMDAEVSAQIGAEHSQRVPDRVTHRNGYRARDWDTRVGTIDLQIPRVREGSYLPGFLEPCRRAERSLAAVVAQCYPLWAYGLLNTQEAPNLRQQRRATEVVQPVAAISALPPCGQEPPKGSETAS